MSLDGLAVRALAHDLYHELIDGRIDKIHQPSHQLLTITLRQKNTNKKLLASIDPQAVRLHLTKEAHPNPLQAPLFCMVMRKHLEGARITGVQQVAWERMIQITCEGYSEAGEPTKRSLLVELMGKHSNVILLDADSGIVLDALRRISEKHNQYRHIQPGTPYIMPPPQNKLALEALDEERFTDALQNTSANTPLHKALLGILAGFGPQSIAEVIFRAGFTADTRIEYFGAIDYARLWQELHQFQHLVQANTWQPTVVTAEQGYIAFAPFPLLQYDSYRQKTFTSFSQLLDTYYTSKTQANLLQQKQSNLEKVIRREIDRCEKKLALQLEKIEEAKDAEKYRHQGELLTASLHLVKQGPIAEVIDFYDPAQKTITIALDPHQSPNENAQRFFKRYAKAKAGAEKSVAQAAHTQEELAYLESILNSLSLAQTTGDLDDIRQELEEAAYVKHKSEKRKSKTKKERLPEILTIQKDTFEILVGKNNKQNDYLTLKIARANDIWLHAKDIPGAHVLIKNHQEKRDIPDDILALAAMLAAHFSKAGQSTLVPVDYTLRKHVKKPGGAKPGMVIYEQQKTLFITPDQSQLQEILGEAIALQ